MKYRHYKGGLYRSLLKDTDGLCAVHSETGQDLMIYQSVDGGQVWARPANMFFEQVQLEDGASVPRFKPEE